MRSAPTYRRLIGRRLLAAAVSTVVVSTMLAATGTPAGAATPVGAGAWIVENVGQADVNSDVFSGSTCFVRDVIDAQRVGPSKANSGAVTVGGCVFGSDDNLQDVQVSFETTGVGVFTWCADPDGGGARTATLAAGDTRCTMTGFNPSTSVYKAAVTAVERGVQSVVFCVDPGGDGCANEAHRASLTVGWTTSKAEGVTESLYQRLLGRTGHGDPGRAYWVDLLDSGQVALPGVAGALLRSDEGLRHTVNLLFRETLDRPADKGGRSFWSERLRSTNIEQVRSELLATAESRQYTDGTPEDFVRRVYPRILGRFADDAGVAFFAGRIRAGFSYWSVGLSLHYSREGREQAVKNHYFCCLHRVPSAGEVDYWVGRFGGTFDEAELRTQIQGSAEHANMFA